MPQHYPEGTLAKNKDTGEVTHVFEGGKWMEYEGTGEFLTGMARSVLGQGALMGLGDEAEAKVREWLGDEPYAEIRDRIRAENEAYAQRHPVLSPVGEVAGGFATGGLGGARALAARGLSTGAKALRSAGVGAGFGGLSGLGYSEADLTKGDYTGAGVDAFLGLTLGTTLGAGMPFLAKAGQTRPMQALKEALIPRSGAAQARAKVVEALAMDARAQGVSEAQLLAKLDDMPDEAFVGDLGENLRGLVSGITNVKGEAKEAGQRLLRERMMGRGERMLRTAGERLDEFGEKGADVLEAIIARRKMQGGQYYKTAFEEGTQVNVHAVKKELEGLIAKAAGPNKALYQKTLNFLYTGTGKDKVLKADLEELQGAKEAIDTMLERGRMGTGKVAPKIQGRLEVVQRNLVNKMKDASPNYRQGWAIYTDEWTNQKALEKGATIFSQKKKILEVDPLGSLEKMSVTEKDLYRLGVFGALENIIEGSPQGVNRARRLLETKQIRQRLRAAFDSDQEWQRFSDTMDSELSMMATERAALFGSRTTPLAENIQNITGPIDMGLSAARAVGGGGIDPAAAVRGLGQARRALTAPASQVGAKMMPYLMNPSRRRARLGTPLPGQAAGLLTQAMPRAGGARPTGAITGALASQMRPGIAQPLLGLMGF